MFGKFDKYIAVFLTALVVTYLLTPLVRSLARRFGIMDWPNERRPHKHPTARGGGLAVVVGVQAALLVALLFPEGARPGGFDLHWWLNFAPASLILLAVGLVDDIRGLGAWKKLAGQAGAAWWICYFRDAFRHVIRLPSAAVAGWHHGGGLDCGRDQRLQFD